MVSNSDNDSGSDSDDDDHEVTRTMIEAITKEQLRRLTMLKIINY